MGLLQAAYRTYESRKHLAGEIEEEKEPLIPVSHIIVNAQLEITISKEGVFQSVQQVAQEDQKTIISVTEKSANRTSGAIPHPLCDQLKYLTPFDEDKLSAYLEQISQWDDSIYTHPKVHAVRLYVQGRTILEDITAAGIIERAEISKNMQGALGKSLVRWRVIPADEGESSAVWKDASLFDCFAAFYNAQNVDTARDLCIISGKEDIVCEMHPKGTVAMSFGAKLISSNDNQGFTYRGRFSAAKQAFNVGYEASQKAHSALRYVIANEGYIVGSRVFLCWNPEGVSVPMPGLFQFETEKTFAGYKDQIMSTLGGYKNRLKPEADVIVAALEAVTTGRLSITYYNELKGSDFLSRIESWYETCCWHSRYGVQSPPIKEIARIAFGVERGNLIEADDRVLRDHFQQLLHCIVDKMPIPLDIVYALFEKASTPLAYKEETNREKVLNTACAIIRKFHNDRLKKEEWGMALDETNSNRSYLFGRLLAVAEQAEKSTYTNGESRETNAIRMQAVFVQRPLYAWRIIEERLNPYFARMQPGLRAYFKNIIGGITEKLPAINDPTLGRKLEDVYLLGYYHQRMALWTKKEINHITEENEDERIEKQD